MNVIFVNDRLERTDTVYIYVSCIYLFMFHLGYIYIFMFSFSSLNRGDEKL